MSRGFRRCVALVTFSLFVAPAFAASVKTPPAEAAGTRPAPAAQDIPLEDIQAFAAVYRAVKEAYVEPVDDHELMQDAIRGLLAGLDPHSEYLDTSGLSQLDEDTTGQYAGLGIEVLFLDGQLRVVSPLDNSPASRAGIKSGDVIMSIDGKPVLVEEGQRGVDRLRGKPGSRIALTIAREGSESPLELSLKREIIRVASVRTRVLEPGYAYLRIAQFQEQTGAEVREKLRRLAAKQTLRGVVLDLRSNPGGLLNAAVEVTDAFLDDGVIVTTRGRVNESDSSYSAQRGDLIGGAPLIVLVDGGTASAAEIVAGALKDNHRALIMGQRTFGKGSVQSVLNLSSGDALKLTTARYFTPSGTSIQAAGIAPDILLGDLRLTLPDGPASVIAERDLPGHLRGELESADEAGTAAIETDDYALAEAINVLKGLALAQERAAKLRTRG
jgi:carboxyl-terminal processing protease